MKPQAICPTGIRPDEYFTIGNKLYLIQVDGSVANIKIKSIPTNGSSFNYKVGPWVTPCKFNSPAILSKCELLWVQKILKKYPKVNPMESIVLMAQNGNRDAIILIGFIIAVRDSHKSSSQYKRRFADLLIDSLRKVKAPTGSVH